MVFESVVVEILNRFLGDYVENLDSNQLKIGIWGGDVVLNNLVLKQTALDDLDLPVKTIYGQLGKLVLKIPWKNLYGAPVQVEIEKLFLLAVPNVDIVYNAEKEERWAKEAKKNNLLRIEETKRKEQAGPVAKVDDTFVEKLTTQIIKNVQIRISDIHVRYEDKCDDIIYAMGVTLSNLTVVSTDENWVQKLSTELSTHVFKILQLESLAVYWNTPTEIYSTLSHDEITEKFQKNIISKQHTPQNFQYILGPIYSDARLRLHPKPEHDDPQFTLPKILLNLEMDKLQIAINKPQYQCIVLFVESMDRMTRGATYRKFRPKVPYRGHYREWWKFAYNCILEFDVKRRRRNYDIEYIMGHRKLCKEYASCYKEKLLNKRVPPNIQVKVQECEDKLDLFNIVLLRQRVEVDVAKLTEIAKKEAEERTWWSSWFGSSKKSTDEESTTDLLKKFENAMTSEEKQKLYQAIDYTDNNLPTEYPETYVDMVSAFSLLGLVVEIRDENDRRVLSASLHDVKCRIQRRPRTDALNVAVKIDKFTVYGLEQHNTTPELVSSKQKHEKSLLDISYETNPLDSDCHQRITVSSCPLQIIYDAQTIIEIMKIFKTPETVSLEHLSAITSLKMQDLKEKSLIGMQYAIEQHTKLELNIHLASPYIIIPYGGFYSGNESVLIANLGEIILTTPKTDEYRDIYTRKTEKVSDDALFQEMQEFSYEKYVLRLNNFQVLLAVQGEQLLDVLDRSPVGSSATVPVRSDLHLLEPTSLKINIGRCLITNDPRLPKIKVSGKVPNIAINMSDTQLLMVIGLCTSIPLPVSDVPPTLGPSLSAASSLSMIHTMAQQFVINKYKMFSDVDVQRKDDNNEELVQLTEMEITFAIKRFEIIISKQKFESNAQTLLPMEMITPSPSKLNADELIKVCSFTILDLEFDMTTQTYNQDINARLGGISFKHYRNENDVICVLKTPRGTEDVVNSDEYLFTTTFCMVDKKSPEFTTKYEYCEQILFVELRKLSVLLHLESINELLKFANEIQTEINKVLYVPPSDNISEFTTLAHIRRENVLTTIEENIELNIKTEIKKRQRKKKSVNVFRQETILLKVEAHLHEVNVTLENSQRELSSLAICGLYMDVILKKSSIQLIAMLKSISISDPNPASIHKEILTPTGDETLRISVIFYTKDESYKSDTDLDLSVNVRVGAVRIVFLNWFVSSQLGFLNNFQNAQKAIMEASAAAAEQAKQNVQNVYEKSMRIKLKVNIKAPDIIIPVNSNSLNAMLIDLGHLTLANSILTLKDIQIEKSENHPVIEEIHIILENMKISRVQLESDKYTFSNEVVILEPVTISLEVQRNLTTHIYDLIPDVDIIGRLKKLEVNLSEEDYKMIMSVLQRNLSEGQVTTNVTTCSNQPIKQLSGTTISQTLGEREEFPKLGEKAKVNVFLKFTFTLDTLIVSLYTNEKGLSPSKSLQMKHRDHRLGQFSMDVLSVKGRILSDQTIITSVVLVDCILDDTRRESNTHNSIKRLLKRRVIEDSNQTTDVQNKSMFDITYQQKGADMFVDIRIFSFEFIIATDYLMSLLAFVTPDLDEKDPEDETALSLIVGHGTTTIPVASNLSKVNVKSKQLEVVVPENNTSTMTINIRIEQPDLIFVETTKRQDISAVVLNCELIMKARFSGDHQVINGSIKDLSLFTSKFQRLADKSVLHSILKPISISLAGSTPAGDDSQGLHIDIIATDVRLSVSPASIELINQILSGMSVKNETTTEHSTKELDFHGLWDSLIFKDNDFWFLRADEAQEVCEEWIATPSVRTMKSGVKRNEMCILNVPSIVVTLETGVGNQTLPMILLETKVSGIVGNWSSEMYVDCSLTLQMAYYNSTLAVWEPLIEPNEYFNDDKRITEPWEIKFEMQIKNDENDLNSTTPLSTDGNFIEEEGFIRTPQQCILITSKENLEITMSKTCLEVISILSKAFSNAIQVHDSVVWNVDSAPYCIVNDTGLNIVLVLYSTAFMVADNPNCNEVQIGSGGKVLLELKQMEMMSEAYINYDEAITETNSERTIAGKLPKVVNVKIDGSKYPIELPISRADKRYFPLSIDKDPNSKWGIISDIKVINGCTTVCIRSIVQVHNHFDHALDVYYMNEDGKSVDLVDTVEPQSVINLSLSAVYSPSSEIFFGLPGYTISNTPFIWKDLQLNLAMVKLLECRPKDNKTTKNSFFIKAMGEIEQVYNETTSKHTMISVCYNVHLRPTVSLRNCLPFPIVLCISGSIEELLIEPGHVTLLPTVEPDVSQIVIRLDDYLEKTWSCKRSINPNSPEFSVWAFDSYDSALKMTLDLGVHKSFQQGSILLDLYCPFWMINKTGMMLTYRNNSDDSLNVLYHPEHFKGPILFSFNSKNFFGKKKASIRVENGEWSNKFSIDVAGSSGVVACKYNGMNYQIGVQNQLTYNGLTKQIVFTPLFILINHAAFTIETQEIDRLGDPWIRVEPDGCTPLWPKSTREEKLLHLKVLNTVETSPAFLITEVHATLLKLQNKYGGVNVDIQIVEGATYITFSSYEPGLAPGLIINHTKYPMKYWEKESINVRTLDSYNCILYTWENPSGKRVLVWDSSTSQNQSTKYEIENDLRQDGIGEFFINDDELDDKVLIYWVSFLDGLQRIILFTDQQNIAQNAQTAGTLEPITQEINVSIYGIGFSLVNNIKRKEIMYIGIASSGIVWEVAKITSDRFKSLSQADCLLIEAAYQNHLQQLAIHSNPKTSSTIIGQKIEIDFFLEMMIRPNKRRLRRTFQTGFWMQLKTSEHQLQLHAKINRLQIDNQLYDCVFPVVLAPVPLPKSVAANSALKPFAELSIVQRIMKHSPVQQFKYFKVLIQEFHVKVDLGFINAILECVEANELSEAETLEYFKTDLKLVDEPLHSHVSTQALQDHKNFYDLLHFSPLKIHVSFSLQTGSSDNNSGESATPEYLSVLLQGIGVTLTDVHDVVFRLAYFERNFTFLTQKQLISEASLHYVGQLVKQLYVLVLGLDVIGNPYGLVLGITKGVEDLFYEPFQGAIQGPGEFAEGLVLGVRSLLGHTVGGAAGAVSRITGAMGKGIAAFTFDDDYQKRRRELINKKPANLQEGLARSGKGLVMGVFDGVTGVFSKPIAGAKEQGVEGFFKGLGKGAIGLVARPTAGVVDFASGSLDAVKRCAEGEETSRLRAPRFISYDRLLLPYCRLEAEGHKLLMELEKGKYANTDIYVFHAWIIQRKEIILLTDKRVAYVVHNDLFGGWQVDWAHTWQEMSDEPKCNERGIFISIGEQKKKMLGIFGANATGKLIALPESNSRQLIYTKMRSLFYASRSVGQKLNP